ncbi:MAG: DNA primase [Euryarchaeota archaeon]|nr:DNA primase [Euryarchaeota archaeon]
MAEADTTKYMIRASISAEGVVEKPDIIGAVFGQTEGLLGEDLNLRDLQKTGRIGRIEVNVESKGGKAKGSIIIPSSLDKTETAILAASLETIDRIGPCVAAIKVEKLEDLRESKRKQVVERAKQIMEMFDQEVPESQELTEEVRQSMRVEEIRTYGPDKCPAGPNIDDSDAILVVEGRADVLNLLRHGIKNAIAVEGTNVPKTVIDLCKKKTVTAFTDGDRGGELILKELFQVADVDFVARAPDGKGLEDLTQKEIVKCLRNKLPLDQYLARQRGGDGKRFRKDRGRPAGDTAPAEGPERPPAPPVEAERAPGEEIRERPPRVERVERPPPAETSPAIREHFQKLGGTLQGRILSAEGTPIKEVPVRELADTLQATEGAQSVVFDGIITQRILDTAQAKGVQVVAGARTASGIRPPPGIRILTARDLS